MKCKLSVGWAVPNLLAIYHPALATVSPESPLATLAACLEVLECPLPLQKYQYWDCLPQINAAYSRWIGCYLCLSVSICGFFINQCLRSARGLVFTCRGRGKIAVNAEKSETFSALVEQLLSLWLMKWFWRRSRRLRSIMLRVMLLPSLSPSRREGWGVRS